MRTWKIYCARHVTTNRYYVGQTHRNFEQRKHEHIENANHGKLRCFHDALRKYGENAFEWKVLETGIRTLDEACHLEQEWIKRLNSHVTLGGFNLTFGGQGSNGFKHSKSARKKIGDRFRGKPKSITQRRKMGQSISRARKGKKYGRRPFKNPEEAHKNMREWQLGKPKKGGWHHSEKTKSKMRKSHRCSLCGEIGHKRPTCEKQDATTVSD